MTDSKKHLRTSDITLAARIKAERFLRHKSQDEIAASCGISPASYAHYESGRNRITWGRICQIADALGISVVELITPLLENKSYDPEIEHFADILATPHTVMLLEEWSRIESQELRALLVELLKWLTRKLP